MSEDGTPIIEKVPVALLKHYTTLKIPTGATRITVIDDARWEGINKPFVIWITRWISNGGNDRLCPRPYESFTLEERIDLLKHAAFMYCHFLMEVIAMDVGRLVAEAACKESNAIRYLRSVLPFGIYKRIFKSIVTEFA